MNEKMIHRGDNLTDLVRGVVPAFDGWTNDPTDAADMTDGNLATIMTTGNKVLGAGYQYAYLTFDLGAVYRFLVVGVGEVFASAGTGNGYIEVYNNAGWDRGPTLMFRSGYGDMPPISTIYGVGSQVRISLTLSVAGTMTPNIREFKVLRLK